MIRPEVRYASSGETSIAYQVVGDSPSTLVLVPGFVSHLDLAWDEASSAGFLERLAEFSRLIIFDKRGTGLSDPVTAPPTTAQRIDDIRAVMDATDTNAAALLGVSEGGALAALFAATFPDRVHHLVLFGSFARLLVADDYPYGWTRQHLKEFVDNNFFAENANPSVADDQDTQGWLAKYYRSSASPAMLRSLMAMNSSIDIRDHLGSVRSPTLVTARANDDVISPLNSRYLAEHIDDAEFVELQGVDHWPWFGDQDAALREIRRFLTGSAEPVAERRGRFGLTPREQEILKRLLAGDSAKRIATKLYISERTVESHIAHVYRKIGVSSRAELWKVSSGR
jgi:pimeloyl-ACP methyl ester carboxylesterase/DNA-binding CsgD family transcriptional regulator